MTIPLQTDVVYGPMRSRRFGTSLGINLLPGKAKLCNFDCVYCQYSNTPTEASAKFPTLKQIQLEVEQSLQPSPLPTQTFDWIMIAGNGEPTLHPLFPEVVDLLIFLRDLHRPGLPIGILSNASTCHQLRVRQSLAKLDRCFLKLDAGSERVFQKVNRPVGGHRSWTETVTGLSEIKNIVVQSLFFEGPLSNTGEQDINDWTRMIRDLAPRAVQIYTVDRQPDDLSVKAVSHGMLSKIATYVEERSHVPAVVYG